MELTADNPLAARPKPRNLEDGSDVCTTKPASLLDSMFDAEETLCSMVIKNRDANILLRILGILWSNNEWQPWEAWQYTWNVTLRLGLVGDVVIACVLMGYGTSYRLDYYFFNFAFLLQAIVLALALPAMYKRMSAKVPSFVSQCVGKGVRLSYLVLCVTCLVDILPIFVAALVDRYYNLFFFVFEQVPLCVFMSASMYFIATDCAIALLLLNELDIHRKLEKLTFDQYEAVRKEIELLYNSSLWINDAVVLVAFVNVGAIISVFLFFNHSVSIFVMVLMLGILAKDVPFPIIVLWQIAKVNERAAKFQSELASIRWSVNDHERLTISHNVQANPIAMRLAGMKLKRKDVVWQMAVWLFAFAISIVKAFVAKKVV